MSKHTTPLPHADQTGLEAAQPAQRAPRFDERGIALQTVIIMVVLLAIAGGVAAVLFSRANEATEQLEDTEIAKINYTEITSEALCKSSGGDPQDADGDSLGAADYSEFDNCAEP